MKRMYHLISIVMSIAILFSNNLICNGKEYDCREEMIYNYAEYVNGKELDNYIELFDSETQEWMMKQYDDPNFFLGEIVEIVNVKSLSYETGIKAAFIDNDEFGDKEVSVYYVQATCDTSKVTNENIKSLDGDISYVFVFVKENDSWKIGRVSIADVSHIVDAKEGFENNQEEYAVAKEINSKARLLFSAPTSICVKMTKTDNYNYWNSNTYVDVPFEEYILNVVPNEYVVCEGGEYLKAGTMAAKMFGWYYTIHKKYPNSPGGCDVQDTSVDQNYDAGSYDNLGVYKVDMDTAYAAIENKALVDSVGNIFLTQYVSSKTDSTAGVMGAETALSLSESGSSYLEILQSAYNYSTNANGKTVKIVTHN